MDFIRRDAKNPSMRNIKFAPGVKLYFLGRRHPDVAKEDMVIVEYWRQCED